jgi:hypothetical protein
MKRLLALLFIIVLVAVPATSSVPPDVLFMPPDVLFMHYAATAVVVPATSDVLWGVAAIARYLNQTEAAA